MSTTEGRWTPSVIAAGAISISVIVIFPSTSTAAVVTICWQQLSKVSLRLLYPFEHARPRASLMPSFDNCLGRFRLARVPHRPQRHGRRLPDRDGSGRSWTRAEARSTRRTSLACAMPCAVLTPWIGLCHSPSGRACALLPCRAGRVWQAILSRVAFSRSFSFPVVKRSPTWMCLAACCTPIVTA
jgi:hypothetical protein